MAVPVSGGQGQWRPVFAGLPRAGADVRFYAADLGYCHRPPHERKCHWSVHPNLTKMEISRHPEMPIGSKTGGHL